MAHGSRPDYLGIWAWLIALTVASVALSLIFGSGPLIVLAFFLVAGVKATLVALNYMHLRFEPRVIYAIALAPVLFVLLLTVALFPDFVFSR
jgi:caa(3)-type oxidase subunit IV